VRRIAKTSALEVEAPAWRLSRAPKFPSEVEEARGASFSRNRAPADALVRRGGGTALNERPVPLPQYQIHPFTALIADFAAAIVCCTSSCECVAPKKAASNCDGGK